jgi:hypothetical protein
MSGLDTIAQVAIGLAGFSGVFVALTQRGGFEPADRFRLQFLLFASMGALFLALLPSALFARSWSDETAWRVLGWGTTAFTTLGLTFIAGAVRLRRDYPGVFSVGAMATQTVLILLAIALSVDVLRVPLAEKAGSYVGVLVLLLAQATIVFIRLLFYRRD